VKNGFDFEVDLLIAGAGAGGMTAAIVAAREGLDVLICEKSAQVGGTTATSAGSLWIPGNQRGVEDDRVEAEQYLDALIGKKGNKELRQKFLATASQAVNYLEANSALAFVPTGKYPDYHSGIPGAASGGRVLATAAFDGRLLAAEFERLRPPMRELMIFGGMMIGAADISLLVNRFKSIQAFRHATTLLCRYLIDRLTYSRGTRLVMGNALAARLYSSVLSAKIPVRFNCPIDDLIVTNGSVRGVTIWHNGKLIKVATRRGVILATGGLAGSANYCNEHLPEPRYGIALSCDDDTADGVRIGMQHGAALATEPGSSGARWAPVSVVRRKDGSVGYFPHFTGRGKPGIIAVNQRGLRFTNEAQSYHNFVEAMYDANAGQTSVPAYLICDASAIRRYGLGRIPPGKRMLRNFINSGYVFSAPTLMELANRLGMDKAGLLDTVERQNSFARSGKDLDFARGETENDRHGGDISVRPNPCLGKIERPPYYAMALLPAVTTFGPGLATNANAQVLNAAGDPIPGLYASGNDMVSIMAGTDPGPGASLGPILTFAFIAAKHASRGQANAETD
jgi:succinate dehydrogenase/fumarate reductase flavoprotein subunit